MKRLGKRIPLALYEHSPKQNFFKKGIFYKQDIRDPANLKELPRMETKPDCSKDSSKLDRLEASFGFVDLVWPTPNCNPELTNHLENTRPIDVS